MAVTDFLRRVVDRILLLEDDFPPAEEDSDEQDDEYAAGGPYATRFGASTDPDETGRIHVLRQSRADFAGMPVILARPKTMDDAKSVGERVRDHVPVIMNMEATDDAMSQRIVDFVGGVVFALQGSISRAGRAVYICSPADIPVEDLKTEPQRPRGSLFELGEEQERIAL